MRSYLVLPILPSILNNGTEHDQTTKTQFKALRAEVQTHIACVTDLQKTAQSFSQKPQRPMTSDVRQQYEPPKRVNQPHRVSVNLPASKPRVLQPASTPTKVSARAPRPERKAGTGMRVMNDPRDKRTSPAVRPHRGGRVAPTGGRPTGGRRGGSQSDLHSDRQSDRKPDRDGRAPRQTKAGSKGDDRDASAEGSRYRGRSGEEHLVAAVEDSMISVADKDRMHISFTDVIGHRAAKQAIEEAAVLPIFAPDLFKQKGIKAWKGILLFGPPGTGKTLLARSVASECQTTFFSCTSSDLSSKFRGESEKLIRILFEMARHYAPSVIFLDEVDGLIAKESSSGDGGESNRRSTIELQTQMDGLRSDEGKTVIVMGATNYPWNLNEAMKRRFQKRIYIPLPEIDDIKKILALKMKGQEMASDVDFEVLSQRLTGYSGSDVDIICQEAAMLPVRRIREQMSLSQIKEMGDAVVDRVGHITMEDFEAAIRGVRPSVDQAVLAKYVEFDKQHGVGGAQGV